METPDATPQQKTNAVMTALITLSARTVLRLRQGWTARKAMKEYRAGYHQLKSNILLMGVSYEELEKFKEIEEADDAMTLIFAMVDLIVAYTNCIK